MRGSTPSRGRAAWSPAAAVRIKQQLPSEGSPALCSPCRVPCRVPFPLPSAQTVSRAVPPALLCHLHIPFGFLPTSRFFACRAGVPPGGCEPEYPGVSPCPRKDFCDDFDYQLNPRECDAFSMNPRVECFRSIAIRSSGLTNPERVVPRDLQTSLSGEYSNGLVVCHHADRCLTQSVAHHHAGTSRWRASPHS